MIQSHEACRWGKHPGLRDVVRRRKMNQQASWTRSVSRSSMEILRLLLFLVAWFPNGQHQRQIRHLSWVHSWQTASIIQDRAGASIGVTGRKWNGASRGWHMGCLTGDKSYTPPWSCSSGRPKKLCVGEAESLGSPGSGRRGRTYASEGEEEAQQRGSAKTETDQVERRRWEMGSKLVGKRR